MFDPENIKNLYKPASGSHKGQNGKLMIIGGSHLFHASTLWALAVASRIVDMVFYASVPENNAIVQKLKKEFRDGIIVPQEHIEDYIKEADAVLIGPGMVRTDSSKFKVQSSKFERNNLEDIISFKDEGEKTYWLTKYLLEKYPEKKWIIDAGALQMMELEWLLPLKGNVVLTPHAGEFERIKSKIKDEKVKIEIENSTIQEQIKLFAAKYNCNILLKGEEDIVCSPDKCVTVLGGNAGMTKGGTGDVLAGLVVALACKNDLFTAASAASYISKQAGESLFKRVGFYFNASDLADEIPVVMKDIILKYS